MPKPWPRALAIAIALATAGPFGYAHSEPATQQQTLRFDLPAASLAETINAIARQSGQVVSLEPVLVRGKQAPAIRGELTVVQALQQALNGSGLELRVTASGNFSVQPVAEGGGALELGSISVYAREQGATTEGSGSYAARAVTIGKGGYVASGSVITESVPDDALAFGRARQKTLPGKGKELRERFASAAAARKKAAE